MTTLLQENPWDLAKRHLGPECTFRFFDDDPASRASPGFQLPAILHDRVLAIASDIQNMVTLSKTNLPSCAYFTFQQENVSYDINGSGTLIAAATERGYIKLFSTAACIDLDDDLKFPVIHSQSNHMLVPRQPIGSANDQHYCTRTLIGPRSYCVRFSPESRLLLSGGVGSIRLWSCETAAGAFAEYQTSPRSIVWCADWSQMSHHFATGSEDSGAWLWCLDRSLPLRFFYGHQEPITDIKFHPNPSTLATCSYDRSVMLWDVRACDANGEAVANPCTRTFADSVEVPRVLQFTRNGRVLICGDESGKISPWDIGEGRKIGSVKAHHGGINDLTVSAEGTILASAGAHGDVALWDMGTLCSTSASGAEALKRFQPRRAITHRVSFSTRNLLHAIGTSKTPQQ
jgi:WD40 repeat protein